MSKNIPVIFCSDRNTRAFWNMSCSSFSDIISEFPFIWRYLFLFPFAFVIIPFCGFFPLSCHYIVSLQTPCIHNKSWKYLFQIHSISFQSFLVAYTLGIHYNISKYQWPDETWDSLNSLNLSEKNWFGGIIVDLDFLFSFVNSFFLFTLYLSTGLPFFDASTCPWIFALGSLNCRNVCWCSFIW